MTVIFSGTPIIPTRLLPAVLTPLHEDAKEELHEARLWQFALRVAEEGIREGLSGNGSPRGGIRELNILLGAAGLIPDPQGTRARAPLLEYFRYQAGNGAVLSRLGNGIPGGDGSAATHLPPNLPGDGDAECCLVQALCRYIRLTGDTTVLSERFLGHRVADRVFDAMEYLWTLRWEPGCGLIRNEAPAGADATRGVGVHINSLAHIALGELLELTLPTQAQRLFWNQRRADLKLAVRKTLWDEVRGKFIPRRFSGDSSFTPPELVVDSVFYPTGTAYAIHAGFLTTAEAARSLTATLEALRLVDGISVGFSNTPPTLDSADTAHAMPPHELSSGGEWTLWASKIALMYASAGFCGQAMEMLRPVAERVLRDGGFQEWYTHADEPRGNHSSSAAAAFLRAIKFLQPEIKTSELLSRYHVAPAPAATETHQMFAAPNFRKFSFRKIAFDEKRIHARVQIELPASYVVKGLRPKQVFPGVIRHPSPTGLGLQMTATITEGATLDITTHITRNGHRKSCALRGRVVWSRSKIGTRLYHAGVELDARSKGLKHWQAFISEQQQQAPAPPA